MTVLDAGGSAVVSAATATIAGSVATYTFGAGVPGTTYTLGDGWTVIWSVAIGGEFYTFRRRALLCQYVPRNVITAADLYGGDGIPELRYKVPQAQDVDRGDGTGWGPQIDSAYYELIRRMLADGRPIWRSREPTGYRDWLLSLAILRACESIPANDGTQWAQERRNAWSRFQRAESRMRLQYDTEDSSIRRPGMGPIYTSPVGRPAW